MSRSQDLHVDAGESFGFTAQWLHSDNSPYDLTGAVIVSQVRGRFPTGGLDPDPVAEFTCAADDNGVLLLSLTGEQTALIPPGSYVYDVLVTPSGGTRKRLLRGSVHVSPTVTLDDEGES